MWIYLKNNWVLFILKMSGSRGSLCSMKWVFRNKIPAYNIVLKGNKDLTYDHLLWATVWEQLWSKVQQMPVLIYHLCLGLLNSLVPSG